MCDLFCTVPKHNGVPVCNIVKLRERKRELCIVATAVFAGHGKAFALRLQSLQ